jgi:hypothetical protein
MIRYNLLILTFLFLVACSCSSRKNKLDKRHLIPEKELVSILTDVHLADGLLTIPKIHDRFSSFDTTTCYVYIIQKHGYSKETMDKTLKYYFFKKPKELIKIYDEVLGILSKMESLVVKESNLPKGLSANLWPGKDNYYLTDNTSADISNFDLDIYLPGTYTLSFSATLFPDDPSVNPRISAYTCHPDSIETGKRSYIKAINYIKDGRPHVYTFVIKVPENSPRHLRGWLFDFDNHSDEIEKNVSIENISITYSSALV